ncbi:hypothetical protein [Desmospora profundinema]|uniref:Uncharacterized protein n=1 Tax=Desmospora profundinema TaxID=1571184 RepID=A0ABU1IT30_9BACL|nr:hypothetical protein [Desmospora profundinema]MDR6227598.1 hypothetical protein [Desmospora profundinema]
MNFESMAAAASLAGNDPVIVMPAFLFCWTARCRPVVFMHRAGDFVTGVTPGICFPGSSAPMRAGRYPPNDRSASTSSTAVIHPHSPGAFQQKY